MLTNKEHGWSDKFIEFPSKFKLMCSQDQKYPPKGWAGLETGGSWHHTTFSASAPVYTKLGWLHRNLMLQKQLSHSKNNFFFEVFLKIIPDLFLHSYTDSKDQNLVKSGAGQKEWIGMGSWRREERGQLAATNYHTELGWCKTAASEHNVWWAQWAEQVDNHVPDTDMFVCGGLALPKISLTSWPR